MRAKYKFLRRLSRESHKYNFHQFSIYLRIYIFLLLSLVQILSFLYFHLGFSRNVNSNMRVNLHWTMPSRSDYYFQILRDRPDLSRYLFALTFVRTPIQNPWFMFGNSDSDAGRRLFCFPYGGAGAGAFRSWKGATVGDWQLCLVVPPGREGRFREARYEAITPLVDSLAEAILPFLDRPFAFFGHSVGALTAFELARNLRRNGLQMPDHLFVSGRASPQVPLRVTNYHLRTGGDLVAALEAISRGSDRPAPDPAIVAAMEPLLRSDFAITETYAYRNEGPFDQPVTAFGARNDPTVGIDEIAAWQVQTTGAFALHLFDDGGHFFIDHYGQAIVDCIAAEWKSP
ncbi:thioesterase II family protein [Rhizobium sp. NPDC090279]|uniref:thioesterase II family protein n=1 Tax=Rhizobium sp. NPDC090279 TaxID=3364499 RepID=UPI00383B7E91